MREKNRKICLFALGNHGTMGHFSGVYILAQEILERDAKKEIFIVADEDYSSLIEDKRIKFFKIPIMSICM